MADSKRIGELFARTLQGDYDSDQPWEAVSELRRIADQTVFNHAAEWCKSDDPLKRVRGLQVIAQIGKTADHPTNAFPEESYGAVSNLLRREEDVRALGSAILALGHIGNPLAVPLIVRRAFHPSAEVRFATACALGSFADDPHAVSALLELTKDSDDDVRDWAIFGLGVLGNADAPEIREALVRGIADPNADVREEAMVGLGKRKDERVLPSLTVALARPTITDRVRESAYSMLGMQNDRADWTGHDYAAALKERFHL